MIEAPAVTPHAAPLIHVRPAKPHDADAVGRLGALLVQLHHELDPDRFISRTPETARGYGRFLASQLDEPNAFVLVAEEAGAVVGYAYAALEGNDWMALRGPAGVIHDLIVDPARRREGVGRRLMEAMVGTLSAAGVPRIVLSTAERNKTAQRLFTTAGFRPTMIEMTREPSGPTGLVQTLPPALPLQDERQNRSRLETGARQAPSPRPA